MYVLFPIIAALSLGGAITLQKVLLKKNVNINEYQVLKFLGISIVMLPLLFFFWKLSPEAFQTRNIIIFSIVVLISTIANKFAFFAFRGDKVNNLEPARAMDPLFVVILAMVFSIFNPEAYERDFSIIIPALIAGTALIGFHIEKHHLKFNKYFRAAIYASFLFALELVISKLILNLYNPITFYFLRCFGVFLISYLIFHPKMKNLNTKIELEFLGLGILIVLFRVFVYYGYIYLGITLTTLILMLGPIFIYTFARIFLKEKLHWKNIAASVVILLCLLYVLIF